MKEIRKKGKKKKFAKKSSLEELRGRKKQFLIDIDIHA